MGGRGPGLVAGVVGLACLVCAGAQGCTDGTTPDCSDAQCLVVSVVESGNDSFAGDAEADGGEDAAQASDAADAAQGSAADAGLAPESGPDAAPTRADGGDAASDGSDAH